MCMLYARENDFRVLRYDKLAMKRKAQDASNNKRGALTTTKFQVLRTYMHTPSLYMSTRTLSPPSVTNPQLQFPERYAMHYNIIRTYAPLKVLTLFSLHTHSLSLALKLFLATTSKPSGIDHYRTIDEHTSSNRHPTCSRLDQGGVGE